MSAPYSYEFFSGRIDAGFAVHGTDGVVLQLLSAKALGAPASAQAGFSLMFGGPLTPQLEQCIHRLESPGAEALDIFLVPVARGADGMRYQAIFN
jgi:hypothetical protein